MRRGGPFVVSFRLRFVVESIIVKSGDSVVGWPTTEMWSRDERNALECVAPVW